MKWTVICREVDSDCGPVYPDPLIYIVETEIAPKCMKYLEAGPALTQALQDGADEQRRMEVDFDSELEICFAFKGEPDFVDWRV